MPSLIIFLVTPLSTKTLTHSFGVQVSNIPDLVVEEYHLIERHSTVSLNIIEVSNFATWKYLFVLEVFVPIE